MRVIRRSNEGDLDRFASSMQSSLEKGSFVSYHRALLDIARHSCTDGRVLSKRVTDIL